MGCSGCKSNTNQNKPWKNVNKITMSKKELANEILGFMGAALGKAGPAGRFSTGDLNRMIQLHNDYFDTSISPGNISHCKLAVVNMRALYNNIKNGNVTFEDAPVAQTATTVDEAEAAAEALRNPVKDAENIIKLNSLPADVEDELTNNAETDEKAVATPEIESPGAPSNTEKYSENEEQYTQYNETYPTTEKKCVVCGNKMNQNAKVRTCAKCLREQGKYYK